MNTFFEEIKELIKKALEEDKAFNDITSKSCIDDDIYIASRIVLKQKGVVAGLEFLPLVFHAIDPELKIQTHVKDGEIVEAKTTLATITGKARSILSAERVALNIVQHASAVATQTQRFVVEVAGLDCAILDTRKTLPGLRALQRYGVRMGGGKNHRYDLSERFLIKDNHLAILEKSSSSPVGDAIERARSYNPRIMIEIEVEDLEMLRQALDHKADIILLDNMNTALMEEAVSITNGRAYLEASGGIHLNNVRAVAETGVNAISIGALTHSVLSIDISLEI
jgi:nicotinate-nucleotide pyrophosphorylase (carboxylating)